MGEVKWLEDDPIAEWAEHQGDRWTNVPGQPLYFRAGSIFSYDPAESPILRILASNYTSIERRKPTRRERIGDWIQRGRRRIALLVDPTLEEELEDIAWEDDRW